MPGRTSIGARFANRRTDKFGRGTGVGGGFPPSSSKLFTKVIVEPLELGEVETYILHWIVSTVAGPQFQIMNRRCRRYQRISQFNAMALAVLSQILPSLPTNLQVDGHTLNCREESIQNLMLCLPRSVPDLGDRNWRAQEGGISQAQTVPSGENRRVFGARDFN